MSKECKICHITFQTDSLYALICSDECREVSAMNSLKKFRLSSKGRALKKRERESANGKMRRRRYEAKQKSKELSCARTKKRYDKVSKDVVLAKARNENRRAYYVKAIRTDVGCVIRQRMSTLVRKSLKNNKQGQWQELVGYTVYQLRERLESTMPTGYSWEDFLKGELHIDHIYPVSRFNIISNTDTDFKKCWSLKNLQLLPRLDNLRKGNKLLYENHLLTL